MLIHSIDECIITKNSLKKNVSWAAVLYVNSKSVPDCDEKGKFLWSTFFVSLLDKFLPSAPPSFKTVLPFCFLNWEFYGWLQTITSEIVRYM